ncbi:MAG: hypothetical protein AAGA96_03335 [Verrucomicrobiota bacterium]
MSLISRVLFLGLAWSIFLTRIVAQDNANNPAPEAGFLQFVNLISLKTPTHIRLSNFDLNGGEAILPGDTSGILAIKPNEYNFTISNEGAKPASISGPISVVNGQNTVVICYDEASEEKEEEEDQPLPKLRFNLLTESLESDLPRLSLVSLLKVPAIEVRLSGKLIMLQERRAHRQSVEIDDVINVTKDGKSLGGIEIEKRSHYIAFIFLDPETGEEGISIVQNEKLEYHPPLEDDETETEDEQAEDTSGSMETPNP